MPYNAAPLGRTGSRGDRKAREPERQPGTSSITNESSRTGNPAEPSRDWRERTGEPRRGPGCPPQPNRTDLKLPAHEKELTCFYSLTETG